MLRHLHIGKHSLVFFFKTSITIEGAMGSGILGPGQFKRGDRWRRHEPDPWLFGQNNAAILALASKNIGCFCYMGGWEYGLYIWEALKLRRRSCCHVEIYGYRWCHIGTLKCAERRSACTVPSVPLMCEGGHESFVFMVKGMRIRP